MRLVSLLLRIAFCAAGCARAARILAVVPMPSRSHNIAFRPLWEALSLRGHDVTVVTSDPLRDKRPVNVTEIDVGAASYELADELYRKLNGLSAFKTTDMFQRQMIRVSVKTLEHPQVQDLIVNRSRYHFDVVFVECLFSELLALGHHYDAATVLVSSFDVQGLYYSALGEPNHPIANPDYVLPFSGEMTFVERVVSVLASLYLMYARVARAFPWKRDELTRFFGEDVPDMWRLIDEVDLMMVNVNPVFDGARPLGPRTIAFGGGVHLEPPRELPKDVKEFLDGSEEGFVYFSLGGNIFWDIPEFKLKLKGFLEAFDKLPYRVLAKYDGKQLEWTPENVMTVEWVQQQDVLRHPKARCFVTQAGRQSMEESIYSHVPMVALPMFADQYQNGRKIQNHGIGRMVRHVPTLDKVDFLDAVLDVAGNVTYKENVARLARLALDQPMTGVEKVVWWTEYLVRNGNADHLRNRAADVPWYQYLLLDVIGALLLALAVVVTVLAKAIRPIYALATVPTKKIWALIVRLRGPMRKKEKKGKKKDE